MSICFCFGSASVTESLLSLMEGDAELVTRNVHFWAWIFSFLLQKFTLRAKSGQWMNLFQMQAVSMNDSGKVGTVLSL